MPTWMILGLLILVATPVVFRVLKLLLLRTVARAVIKGVGDDAIAKQPDEIHLVARPMDASARGATDASAEALKTRGFVDVGEYEIPEMTAVQLRFLLNQRDHCYACVYRHTRAGVWVEVITRYESGLGTTYSQQPDRGMERRQEDRVVNLPGTDPATLHDRMIAERPAEPMLTLSSETIPRLFEQVYAAQIRWKKQRGSSPEEVARVIGSLQKNPIGKRPE